MKRVNQTPSKSTDEQEQLGTINFRSECGETLEES